MWPSKRRRGHELIATAITEGFKLMATTVSDLITALNDNTNAVASRIDHLVATLSNETPITSGQIQQLQSISDHLKALGANPADPVPAG